MSYYYSHMVQLGCCGVLLVLYRKMAGATTAWRDVFQHFLTIEFVKKLDFLWSFGDSALSSLGKCWSVFHRNINLGWHSVVCNIATL